MWPFWRTVFRTTSSAGRIVMLRSLHSDVFALLYWVLKTEGGTSALESAADTFALSCALASATLLILIAGFVLYNRC